MTKQTFLFYDIETTGLNPCFDQIIQFAAIRTDLSLNILEKHDLIVSINPDIAPHPDAMKTHGIALETLQAGLCEYDAISKIHALVNTPGTISLGYNTLGFDDEFLRFSFFRNLLTPYTHQYANQCSRMDIYPITVMYALFNQDIIQWPKKANHQISLKLEDINRANQFVEGQSHLAMVDVEVTLALATTLAKSKEMWQHLCTYFSKQDEKNRLKNITQGYAISGQFGQANQFALPALSLGEHKVYRNQSIWLSLDSEALSDAIQSKTYTALIPIRKKYGEPPFILPMKPRFSHIITETRAQLVSDNLARLQSSPLILDDIRTQLTTDTYPEVDNVDCDAALYQLPFVTNQDLQQFAEFHHANNDQKANMIDHIRHPTYRQIALRIVARNFSDSLHHHHRLAYSEYLSHVAAGRIHDFKGNLKRPADITTPIT